MSFQIMSNQLNLPQDDSNQVMHLSSIMCVTEKSANIHEYVVFFHFVMG